MFLILSKQNKKNLAIFQALYVQKLFYFYTLKFDVLNFFCGPSGNLRSDWRSSWAKLVSNPKIKFRFIPTSLKGEWCQLRGNNKRNIWIKTSDNLKFINLTLLMFFLEEQFILDKNTFYHFMYL